MGWEGGSTHKRVFCIIWGREIGGIGDHAKGNVWIVGNYMLGGMQ